MSAPNKVEKERRFAVDEFGDSTRKQTPRQKSFTKKDESHHFCRDDAIDETAFLRNARDSKCKSSKKTLFRKNNFTKKELPRKYFFCEATLFGWRGMKLKQ